MSIDKFGRQLTISGKVTKGPPGEGFKLTEDGNYDIEGKIIRNVGAPKSSTDVVTKQYLESKALTSGLNTHFYAKNKLIRNVLPPLISGDVVTKGYVDNYFLQKNFNMQYDAKEKRIVNLRSPVMSSDAVNLGYISQHCVMYGQVIDGRDKVITNVKPGTSPSDVVTNSQLLNLIPYKKSDTEWDFENKKITNVKAGENFSDVATYGQVMEVVNSLRSVKEEVQQLTQSNEQKMEDFGNAILTHVNPPGDDNDYFIEWDSILSKPQIKKRPSD